MDTHSFRMKQNLSCMFAARAGTLQSHISDPSSLPVVYHKEQKFLPDCAKVDNVFSMLLQAGSTQSTISQSGSSSIAADELPTPARTVSEYASYSVFRINVPRAKSRRLLP